MDASRMYSVFNMATKPLTSQTKFVAADSTNPHLDFLRVTEAAALSCARWVGKGEKDSADEAACGAMRRVLNELDMDGEIVIPMGGSLSFDDLLQRIHPAESRVLKLAAATPGLFIAFDMLMDEKGKPLTELPLVERRTAVE